MEVGLVRKNGMDVGHDGGMVDQFLEERVVFEDVENADIVPVDLGGAAMGLILFVEASTALHNLFEAPAQAGYVVWVEEVVQHEVAVGVEEGEFFGCRLAVGCHGSGYITASHRESQAPIIGVLRRYALAVLF